MKLSELIERLKVILDKEGDMEAVGSEQHGDGEPIDEVHCDATDQRPEKKETVIFH